MWQRAKRINLHTDFKVLPVKFKQIQGIDVAYREHGNPEGITVFAIPPWPFAGSSYTPISLALEDHIHMIMMDLPGMGGHSGKFDREGTVRNYKEFVEDFISSFDYEDYSFMGLSMGGIISHMIATDRRLHPRKLALISTLFNGQQLASRAEWVIYLNKILRKNNSVIAPHWLIKMMIGDHMMKMERNSQYYQRYKGSIALKTIVKDSLRFDIEYVTDMLISLLSGIDVPGWLSDDIETLIMYADGDNIAFKQESIAMAEHLGIEPIVLDNTDHHHLFYDVNKSSDLLLNFFVA